MTKRGLALVTSAALLILVAVVGSVITDDGRSPAPVEPAENGLIAYSYAGDIYVGDPVSGETTPLVTDPAYEVEPIFAPDGRRVAFVRGDPQRAEAMLVVVQSDGSDERLLFPEGREHRGLGNFGWTPDGDSLVVELDTPPSSYPIADGELSLFDSLGSGEESVLTPPLVPAIGAHYWGHDQIAPMFRPPSGDRILSGDWNDVRVFDRDLATATPLDRALKPYEPYHPFHLTWSPDGTQIGFNLELYTGTSPGAVMRAGGGLFVMDAEGRNPHRIMGGWMWQWSPDGSKIAFERVREETDRAILVVYDLERDEERSLESTSAAGKDAGAKFSTTTYNNVEHHWFYEGWTWAPDGRSLLVLEDLRTRPWVVDIENDHVTELPWEADSAPSWQRVTSR